MTNINRITGKKINYLGRDGQLRMKHNGWTLKLSETFESPESLYTRLAETYSQVKIYYDTTRISGLHSYFAMVK